MSTLTLLFVEITLPPLIENAHSFTCNEMLKAEENLGAVIQGLEVLLTI